MLPLAPKATVMALPNGQCQQSPLQYLSKTLTGKVTFQVPSVGSKSNIQFQCQYVCPICQFPVPLSGL